VNGERFEIAWSPTARRHLARLPEKIGAAVIEFVYGPLAEAPTRVGKPLRLDLEGLHIARRGDYRVIHRIAEVVTILAVEHRSDVYRPR
jgi:mRNA interferase RelE/StbE